MSGSSFKPKISSEAANTGLRVRAESRSWSVARSAAPFREAPGAGIFSVIDTELTTETPIYQYKPLRLTHSPIRLIRLQHGSSPSPIRCFVKQVDLSAKNIHYGALSYEWGQPTNSDPYILVDGCQMWIRQNLLYALMHIRHPKFGLPLWIDALCINQADNEERGEQVQMMGNIFQAAGTVFVWLGLSDNSSDVAMDAIESGKVDEYHDEILELCTRPFWYRVWVIQEINLARDLTIFCGHKMVSGRAFEDFLSNCQKSGVMHDYDDLGNVGNERQSAYIESIESMTSIMNSVAFQCHISRRDGSRVQRGTALQYRTFDWWLSDIIRHDLQCSEPRDILYALVGISSDLLEANLVLDYRKSLEAVFMEAVRASWKAQASPFFAEQLARKMGLDERTASRIRMAGARFQALECKELVD